jgi:hypothetical protein
MSTSKKNYIQQMLAKWGIFFISSAFFLLFIIFSNSCANEGAGPTGGPRDSIPPQIVTCTPLPLQTNFTGKQIVLNFDEYIALDNLSDKIVISPPLTKKPTIKVQGKSVVVSFDEELAQDRTYTIDFKDGIKDYNEGNKIKNYRITFSTGDHIDTLRIGGSLIDALTLMPVENAVASLYLTDDDSLFQTTTPDYIAKSDKKGYFLFDNLPEAEFKLYGLTDGDKNLFYSQATEPIAFFDSIIHPNATFVSKIDTIITETDTVITTGNTEYSPLDLNLRLSLENDYNQYLSSFKRVNKDQIQIVFNEELTHPIQAKLLNSTPSLEWEYIEFNKSKDTVNIWVTDSIIAAKDTLIIELTSPSTDSTGNIVATTDTLKLLYTESVKTQKGKPEIKVEPISKLFAFATNLVQSNFDTYKMITIEAPSPIQNINKEMITMNEAINDSTFKPIDFELQMAPNSKRNYTINYKLSGNTKYVISMDTAVVKTLTGIPNQGFKTTFTTQKADFYGTLIIEISGIDSVGIVQLIKNGKTEEIISEMKLDSTSRTLTFNYLKPDNYSLKLIEDKNNNGKWDPIVFNKKQQPEPVYYFPKTIQIKSNWEIKESWEITSGNIQMREAATDNPQDKKPEKN